MTNNISSQADTTNVIKMLRSCSSISSPTPLTISDLPEDLLSHILSFATNNVRHRKRLGRPIQPRQWTFSRISHSFRRAFFRHISSVSIIRPMSLRARTDSFNIKDWNALGNCSSLRELIIGPHADLNNPMVMTLLHKLSKANIRLTRLSIALNQQLSYIVVHEYVTLFGNQCDSLKIIQPSQQYRSFMWSEKNDSNSLSSQNENNGNDTQQSPAQTTTHQQIESNHQSQSQQPQVHQQTTLGTQHIPSAGALISSLQNLFNTSTPGQQNSDNNPPVASPEANSNEPTSSWQESEYMAIMDYVNGVFQQNHQNQISDASATINILQSLPSANNSNQTHTIVPSFLGSNLPLVPVAVWSPQVSNNQNQFNPPVTNVIAPDLQTAEGHTDVPVQPADDQGDDEQFEEAEEAFDLAFGSQDMEMDEEDDSPDNIPASMEDIIGDPLLASEINRNGRIWGGRRRRFCPMNPTLFTELVQKVPKLRELRLVNFVNLTMDMIKPLRSLSNIEVFELDTNHVEDQVLHKLLSSFVNLKSLTLTQLPQIGERAFRGLCKNNNNRATVEYLSLDRTGRITDAVIRNLVNACTNLTTVKIASCRAITNFAVSHVSFLRKVQEFRYHPHFSQTLEDRTVIYLSCAPMTLRFLHLTSCQKITTDGIKPLGKLPNLQVLRLDGLGNITQDMLRAIGLFPKLHSLYLSGNMYLSDLCVKVLCAQRGRRFLHLTLRDSSHNLSDDALEYIMTWCNSLRTLHATGEFSKEMLYALEDYLPYTTITLDCDKVVHRSKHKETEESDGVPDWGYVTQAHPNCLCD